MNKFTMIGMAGLAALLVSAGCAKEQPQDAQRPYHRAFNHQAGHGMAGDPGALYELLNLTDAQKAKVAEILDANAPMHRPGGERGDGRRMDGRHAQGRRGSGPGDGKPGEKRLGEGTCDEPGAHRHGSGPGEGRPGEGKRGDGPGCEPRTGEMKALRDKVHAEIMAVLTPAQKEKAEALKAQLDKGVIPQELIDLRISKLNELLKLTDEQKTRLSALMKEKGDKLKECRDACDGKKECGDKPRELGRAYMDGVKSILTAAQWETYTDRFRRPFPERDGRYGHMRGIIRDLDLTGTQKDQLRDIMKKAFSDAKETRDAMQAHHDRVRAQIRAILTEEQQKKFDTMKPPMDGPHGRHHKDGCKNGGDCKG